MKRAIYLFFFSCVFYPLHAQSVQKEINEQVWKPFIKNFNEHNTAGFMAVHSKAVVRSPRDSKVVWNWDEYNQKQTAGDQQDIKEKRERTLELRFTERIDGKDKAIDVGVYKTSYLFPDGTKKYFFGRFHVVFRKENGIWKILVDTDSSENGTIVESDFSNAKPM
jgi:hypothetical protein